ncbi:MAG: SGNH/GDSL hydrolase family protein [Oscillospiraceae bacterium]
MKRIIAALTAAAMLTAVGCSQTSGSSQDDNSAASADIAASTTADTASAPESSAADESAPDYSQLSDEEIYKLMVERSLMTTGDMTRMANALNRAKNGENLTVAYIGGSITEGYNAGTNDNFAKIATEWLDGQFPDSQISAVNAGISGTPSILGNVRLERDVLAFDPDIVFVEFAVNDGNAQVYKDSYESLVRTLLSQEKEIAVVLLFTVIKSGHTCQPHMSQVGELYGLPMISLPDSLGVELAEGRMTWEDYSMDESHPNAFGHTMIKDFIAHYYEQVIPVIDDNTGEIPAELPEPIFSDRWQNTHYLDSENFTPTETVNFAEFNTHDRFQHGWMYKGSDGGSFKFNITCDSLALVFKANKSDKYADAPVYVDGELKHTIQSNLSDGWNNPVTEYIIDEKECAEHEVEIVVEGGENLAFFILAFGYSE